jgi:hypothetical protein
MSDIHGHLAEMLSHLRLAGLINQAGDWSGQDAVLWLLGDFFSRGPEGTQTLETAVRLREQAARQGGRVKLLLGNHEVQLLAGYRLGSSRRPSSEITFYEDWLYRGGNPADLESFSEQHFTWLCQLPVIKRSGRYLLQHADATFYRTYGISIDRINQEVSRQLRRAEPPEMDRLIGEFNQRRAFLAATGKENLKAYLQSMGCQVLIHGHTPISKITGQPAESVTSAFLYQDGLCVDVDSGLYLGGPGFIYQLPDP